ncbi:MAG: PilN domain-containing protein [Gemmatimonadota bacterium]|nr:PilN domain-containing protein [Gemmatimonadota bacterium]
MIEVNLLPESQKSRSKKSKRAAGAGGGGLAEAIKVKNPWNTALTVACIVVPAIGGYMWWSQRSTAGELETRLDVATADSARLAELRLVSDSLNERRSRISERVALVEELDRNRFVWPHLLDEISRAVPQLAWLSGLRQTSPLPSVGVQIQGIAANPLAITEFVRNLEASEYVTDVRILGSQKQTLDNGDLSVQAFTLTARFTEPAGGPPRTEPIIATTGF